MDITIHPTVLCGSLEAIPSKSHAHRLIICAALSDRPCKIICPSSSRDIEATVECMRALGAQIVRDEEGYIITPISKDSRPERAVLRCGESGSTLRFLLGVCAALGGEFEMILEGRLASRPLSPLYEILCESSVELSEQGKSPLLMSGRLTAHEYHIAADVSSQFISGLMFASPIIGGKCNIHLTTKAQSTGYIDMTVECLRRFGVSVEATENEGLKSYSIEGRYITPSSEIRAEGDWSNAAFWLCAGAIGSAPVAVTGLSDSSLQPDRAIIDILQSFGAEVEKTTEKYCISPAPLTGIEIDVSQTPDLVPAIAVVAACALGNTRIYGGERLRLKESDRIETVCELVRSLGGEAKSTQDGMIIRGTGISGGVVNSANDHRIAMAAAVASSAAADDITIIGAQATEKSYPAFFEDLKKLDLTQRS